jgi:hypothetical protein
MSSPEIHSHKPTSHYQSAQALAECRVKVSKTELLPPYTAVEYALAGNRNEAFKWLSNACDQHDDWLSYLKLDLLLTACGPTQSARSWFAASDCRRCDVLSPLDLSRLACNASQANYGCYYGQSAN